MVTFKYSVWHLAPPPLHPNLPSDNRVNPDPLIAWLTELKSVLGQLYSCLLERLFSLREEIGAGG